VVVGKGISEGWYAGNIKQIFMLASGPRLGTLATVAYFVVQKFKELTAQEAPKDPYCRYLLVGGHLYHPEIEDKIEVVTSNKIISHFAQTFYDRETFGFLCFHALPLDR